MIRLGPYFAMPSKRLALTFAILFSSFMPVRAGDAYKWTVQYLLDNSRSVFGRSQKVSPRHNRGLAISPDGKYLYVGYHHSFDNAGEVRRIAIDDADYEHATLSLLPGPLGKAIATDDKGRVYIANENEILIFNGSLEQRQLSVPVGVCEGVTVTREGGKLALYGTDRSDSTISRWELTESGDTVSAAKLAGFDGTGTVKVPGAVDLRGLKADSKGNLWIADLKGNQIFKLGADGKGAKRLQINAPMDVAIDGERVFVTRWLERAITVLDAELNVVGSLNVPWEELELSPYGNNRNGALSGIVVVPGKGFFVANETGQTANQKSTYGKADDSAQIIGEKLFRDAFQDDNEPILHAIEVTTAP